MWGTSCIDLHRLLYREPWAICMCRCHRQLVGASGGGGK